ncbi:MAG: ROK family protein [Thermodesulfovibrionales bacterium]|nr:ROK family protein [Thermodesulfovibrionales bacterium]
MKKNLAIVLDIGGTNIRLALVSSERGILHKLKEPTTNEPLKTIHRMLEVASEIHTNELAGIGIAVAGIVDRQSGVIVKSPNLLSLNGVNLVSEISQNFNLPVLIDNDANAATYGEKTCGAGMKYENFVMLTLGTGIGGGVVINNDLLPIAAEIGHMTIITNGNKCSCGNTGCLEAHASARAIVDYAITRLKSGLESLLATLYNGNYFKITAQDIYRIALEGDSLARDALREAGKSLGIGIANVVNIFNPQAIILTGGLIGSWNIYVDSAIKEASRRSLPELFTKTTIIPSLLGDDAGIIGAANLVFRRFSQQN